MPSDDARHRTKVYLEEHVNNANLTEDDDSTTVKFIVAYAFPDYPWLRVFQDKSVSLVFAVDTPETEALPVAVGYLENVPITIWCINKAGISGTKLRWKAEAELRRVAETYPVSSLRTLTRLTDNEKNLGSTVLYSVTYNLRYKRYVT